MNAHYHATHLKPHRRREPRIYVHVVRWVVLSSPYHMFRTLQASNLNESTIVKVRTFHQARLTLCHYHTTHLDSHRSRERRLYVHVVRWVILPSPYHLFNTLLASKFNESTIVRQGLICFLSVESGRSTCIPHLICAVEYDARHCWHVVRYCVASVRS